MEKNYDMNVKIIGCIKSYIYGKKIVEGIWIMKIKMNCV